MPSPGKTLDGYRLIRPIGRGGFGEVWLCQLEPTGELKALKFLSSSDSLQLKQELTALIRYRAVVSDLNCPNLVTVEHVNRTTDGLFYIMPLADGTKDLEAHDPAWQPLTLAALIVQRRTSATWFGANEIRAMMLPLLETVQKLNAAGVVHRDIKPENVLFFRERPCLGDVGLLTDDAAQITRRGTPGYAAPSWYLESGANPDMWGLATTLYALITGNSPDKIGRGAFLYPPQGEASIDARAWDQFHHAIFRATNGDAGERFLHLADFSKALILPPSLPKPAASRVGRIANDKPPKFFWPAVIFALFLLATAVGAGWLWIRGLSSRVNANVDRGSHVTVQLSPASPPLPPAARPDPPKVFSPRQPASEPEPEYGETVAAGIRDFENQLGAAKAKFLKPPPPKLVSKIKDLEKQLKGKVDRPIEESRPIFDELEALAPEIKEALTPPSGAELSEVISDLSNAARRLRHLATTEAEKHRCSLLEITLQREVEDLKTESDLLHNSHLYRTTFGLEGIQLWYVSGRLKSVGNHASANRERSSDETSRQMSGAMEAFERINRIVRQCRPD